jgi:hypothetical protein
VKNSIIFCLVSGRSTRPIKWLAKAKNLGLLLPELLKSVAMGENCAKDPSPFGSEIVQVDEKTPHYFNFLVFNPLIYNISGKYIN